MKLYYSPPSPFARKVRLTAAVLGIKLDLVSMDVFNAPPSYTKINPLIKVPALEMPSGEILVNSPFICQYLAQTHSQGFKIFPQGPELWQALNIQAIADGGAEACMARRWEAAIRAPDKFDPKIDQRHKEKMVNAFDYFENNLFLFSTSEMSIKEISLISFVDYVNFRFPHEKWGDRYPRVFGWAEKWNKVSYVGETYKL
jgi:glutathione S-transferase